MWINCGRMLDTIFCISKYIVVSIKIEAIILLLGKTNELKQQKETAEMIKQDEKHYS